MTDWISFADGVDHYLTFLGWGAGGDKAYVQWLNRGQDELRVYEYDLAVEEAAAGLFRETENAWIDLLDDESFSPWPTAASSCSAAGAAGTTWSASAPTARRRPSPAATWSVSRIEFVDEKKGLVFFSADKEDSTRSDLYQVGLGGGPERRLTRAPGHATA